jgi:dCTP deaminase
MDLDLLVIKDFDAGQLQGASYDFRIGPKAAVTTASMPLDLRKDPLILQPFAAALVLVEETVKLSDMILGRLGAHSNLFRNGIFASIGPQIDPGYSGRMRVSLSNPTERPVLLKYKSPFLTAEFVLLTEAPKKKYGGTHGDADLTEDEVNRLLSRGGPSLRDMHRDILELQQTMKDTAILAKEMPRFVELQQNLLSHIQRLSSTHLGTVLMTSLESGHHRLTRDIPVSLETSDDGFIATFFDANIAMSGDTQEEAFANLRSFIVDTFEFLSLQPSDSLGPEPKRQLRLLQSFIQKI